MLQSMTGYGRCEKEIGGFRISIELKSVNNRYADFSIKLPKFYTFLEEFIREYLKKFISRGKVDVFVRIDKVGEADTEATVNHQFAKSYINALYDLRDTYKLSDDISVSAVARNSDVISFDRVEEDEEALKANVLDVLSCVMDSYVKMRSEEGARLKADIISKLEYIGGEVEKIEGLEPEVTANYQKRLEEKIADLLENADIDKQRLLTEVAIFADKSAVDEEMVRLKSHIKAFKSALDTKGAVGKKMDFLLQEMNREINTTGSKANDIRISEIVINVKCELEKIREQIQNIE